MLKIKNESIGLIKIFNLSTIVNEIATIIDRAFMFVKILT